MGVADMTHDFDGEKDTDENSVQLNTNPPLSYIMRGDMSYQISAATKPYANRCLLTFFFNMEIFKRPLDRIRRMQKCDGADFCLKTIQQIKTIRKIKIISGSNQIRWGGRRDIDVSRDGRIIFVTSGNNILS